MALMQKTLIFNFNIFYINLIYLIFFTIAINSFISINKYYIMKNICDWNNCNEIGEYKAPVEKDNSRKFRIFV